MKIASRENSHFSDWRLAIGLLVCASWLGAHWMGIVDPHRDSTGIVSLLIGLFGVACVVWSAVSKTRQYLFLLLALVVAAMVVAMPFVCVAH